MKNSWSPLRSTILIIFISFTSSTLATKVIVDSNSEHEGDFGQSFSRYLVSNKSYTVSVKSYHDYAKLHVRPPSGNASEIRTDRPSYKDWHDGKAQVYETQIKFMSSVDGLHTINVGSYNNRGGGFIMLVEPGKVNRIPPIKQCPQGTCLEQHGEYSGKCVPTNAPNYCDLRNR